MVGVLRNLNGCYAASVQNKTARGHCLRAVLQRVKALLFLINQVAQRRNSLSVNDTSIACIEHCRNVDFGERRC